MNHKKETTQKWKAELSKHVNLMLETNCEGGCKCSLNLSQVTPAQSDFIQEEGKWEAESFFLLLLESFCPSLWSNV